MLRWPGPVYYGWVMLVAVSAAEVVSWGILYYTFPVFVTPMAAELGWPTASITAAYALALLCSGLAAVPVGRWIDRHGPRGLMTAGACLGAGLLVAWASIRELWAFYLVMAGIGAAMAAVLYEPAFAIVATWFRRRRSRALAVLTFFGAWASVVFIPLSAWLVAFLGWRGALLALAAILAIVTIPLHALFLRRRPQDLGLRPDGDAPQAADRPAETAEPSTPIGQALREARFWWLSGVFAICTFVSVALLVQLIPFLIAHGHRPTTAATVAGLFGLTSLAGRLLLGPLGDRFPRQLVTAGLLVMQLAGLLVLALLPTLVGALVFIGLFGAGMGTLTIMRAALLAEQYGPAHYGSISGAMNLALTGAKTLGPLAAGLLTAADPGSPALPLSLAALVAVALAALAQVRATPAPPP